MVAGTKLPMNRGATATQTAQDMSGNGATVASASYTGNIDRPIRPVEQDTVTYLHIPFEAHSVLSAGLGAA